VTIVFDGDPEVFGDAAIGAVNVVFTQGEPADDKIKSIVERSSSKKSTIVVTDDRDIQYAVRALGAGVSSVKAFLNQGNGPGVKPGSAKKSGRGHEKYIPKTDESKITDELGKIWLKRKPADRDDR